jgi:hypothetical protein
MGVIRKINLMGVPLQVEDLLFNIDRKNKEGEDASHAGRRAIFGIAIQLWLNPKREEQMQGADKCQNLG